MKNHLAFHLKERLWGTGISERIDIIKHKILAAEKLPYKNQKSLLADWEKMKTKNTKPNYEQILSGLPDYLGKIMYIWLCMGLMLLLSSDWLFPQEQQLKFKTIGIEDGLSQGTEFCLCVDSKGFVWIGTEAGLNKYDGYDFTIHTPKSNDTNSLSNNYIYAVIEDHLGILWIGTDTGLNSFQRENETFTRYLNQENNPASISNNKVYVIFEDNSGELWVGTDNGLNKFDREKMSLPDIPPTLRILPDYRMVIFGPFMKTHPDLFGLEQTMV